MNTNEAIYRCYTGKQPELLKRASSHVLHSQLRKLTLISVGTGHAHRGGNLAQNFKF